MTAQTILPANSVTGGFEVANSLRFNDGSSDHLLIAPSSAGDKQTWTWSAWVKRGVLGTRQVLFSGYDQAAGLGESIEFTSGDLLEYDLDIAGTDFTVTSSMVFRDVSAWYHILFIKDVTESTETNRIKVYVNGVQIALVENANGYPAENATNGLINAAGDYEHHVGCLVPNSSFFDGYMAEVVFVDGTAQTNTDFGEFDNSGIWKPIDVSGLTFGDNGFYLDFEADGTSTAFVDSGPDARVITVANNVVHSFAQAKFGGSSIYLDGVNDKLTMPDSNDFDFGTGNFTWEAWIYKPLTGKESIYETRTSGDNNGFNLEFNAQNKFEWYDTSIASDNDLPRDPNAITANTWTHYAVVRNGAICTMYRDGTSVGTPLDVGTDADMVSAGQSIIGINAGGQAATSFEGFFDEMRLSSVARYTGNFTAPSAAFTSDSDTVFLIQSNASNLISADVSGEGNHLTSSGLTLIDQSTDTCTNNFATINPLDNFYAAATLAEGNLKVTCNAGNTSFITGTVGLTKGKWYWEAKLTTVGGEEAIGITDKVSTATDNYAGQTANSYSFKGNNGNIRNNDNNSTYGSAYGASVIGVYMDLDNNKLYFAINGTVQASGAGFDITDPTSTTTGFYFPMVGDVDSDAPVWEVNFGNPISPLTSAVSDVNGYGSFEYDPSAGTFDSASKDFLAICTKNLATDG